MHSATIFFALAAVVATVSAGGIAADYHAYPAYRYSYGVADKVTGDQKSASEVRDGGVTRGSYSLLQSDGVVRTVNYISTPLGGFQAQVLNNGVAAHPAIVGRGIGGIAAPGLAVGRGLGLGAIAAPGLALGRGLGLGVGIGGLGLGGARSVVGAIGVPVAGLGLGAGIGLGGAGIIG